MPLSYPSSERGLHRRPLPLADSARLRSKASDRYERQVLDGELIGLRARQDSDIEIFENELLNDVETRVRSDGRPWRPIAPGSAHSPYRESDERGEVVVPFSAVELATGELAGEAMLWGIDLHNRNAHIGLSLRPAFPGRHLGPATVRLLCRHGFPVPGAGRAQGET